jgi:phage replication O-like protein O
MNKLPETRTAVEYQFTPIPSEALERLAAAGLTGREFRIILVVMRKTWGWSKEKDRIALSQFARYTGIDRRKCHALLTSLAKQKIIKRTVAVKGDRKAIMYSFNDIFAEWKLSPSRGIDDKKSEKTKTVPLQGDRLSPSTATKLSPSTAHTIDNNRNLLIESGEAPLGPPDEVQGLSLPEMKAIPLPIDIEARRNILKQQAALLMSEEARGIGNA